MDGTLELVALERLVVSEPSEFDLTQVAERSGFDTERIRAFWRALGFPDPRPDRAGLHRDRHPDAQRRRPLHRRRLAGTGPGPADGPGHRLVDEPGGRGPGGGGRGSAGGRPGRRQRRGGGRRVGPPGGRGAAAHAADHGAGVAPSPRRRRAPAHRAGHHRRGRDRVRGLRRPGRLHGPDPGAARAPAGRGRRPVRDHRLRPHLRPRGPRREDDRRRGHVHDRHRGAAGPSWPSTWPTPTGRPSTSPTCGSGWPADGCSSATATSTARS